MKKINHIIVPTDFSPTARNAYDYAKRLADFLEARLTVVHVNEYILPAAESVVTPISNLEIDRLTAESMEIFVADEDAADTHVLVQNRVDARILRGDVVEQLVKLSESEETELIVIGTTGNKGFLSKVIGSTALSVANQAHCPVILVPHNAVWQPIQHIMYTSNYDSTMPKMIEEITEFGRSFNATMHFINLNEGDSSKNSEKAGLDWDTLFQHTKHDVPFEVHHILGPDKLEKIKTYAEKHHISMIAFVSKHRSFWESLMRTSITENISLSSEVPLMVIHLDDK